MLPRSDHSRDPGGEDFLFHLFRGSELLQDSRVHEAKEELEKALLLQPSDPKGQDLLAVVYFRIGHYPRAINIYERLKHDHPGRTSLSLNLALCYLKTGQAQLAREELEEVVRVSPEHRRAWGYLGLAYERLADYDKAELAFERGGHAAMARRMTQRRGGRPSIVSISSELAAYSVRPVAAREDSATHDHSPLSVGDVPSGTISNRPLGETGLASPDDMRAAAAEAFEELDSGELSFVLAQAETRRPEPEMWHPVEIGEAIKTVASDAPLPAPAAPFGRTPPPRAEAQPPAPEREREPERGPVPPVPFPDLLAAARIAPIPSESIATTPAGQVVVHLQSRGEARNFGVRFDTLRSYTGTLTTNVLERRGRGAADSFGGISGTVMQVSGDGMLVLSPRPGRNAAASALGEEDILFLREDAILAFDLAMTFENGRLARGDDEPILVVQLRGPGPMVFEYAPPLATLEVTPTQAATVRGPSVLGWTGHLVPALVPTGEAPGGQRGLISFVGAGTVLVAGR